MNKQIIVLCAIFALAKGHDYEQGGYNQVAKSEDRTDLYISFHRRQIVDTLENYKSKLQKFEENHSGQVQDIDIYRDLLVDSIVQLEERLNPLEILNDENKGCSLRYRKKMKNVTYTRDAINLCVTTAYTELKKLTESAFKIYNELKEQHKTFFEDGLTNCEYSSNTQSEQYQSCVFKLVQDFTAIRVQNQKEFQYALDTAECDAKAHVKRAIDCNFAVETDVLTTNSVVDFLVNNCIWPENTDVCPPCEENTCDTVHEIQADYVSETIANPLLSHASPRGCLMLSIVD